MALSDNTKINYSWKKWNGRQHTDNDKAWFEEYPGEIINIHGNSVWVDDIPNTPPTATDDTIEVYDTLTLTEDPTVGNHRAWLACSTPGDLNTRIRSWISPYYGTGYSVRLYDNNDIEIPSSHPSNWFFDYNNGIIVFESDPTSYGIVTPVKIKAYRYIGQTISGDQLGGSITEHIVNSFPIVIGMSYYSIGSLARKYWGSTHIQEADTIFEDHYSSLFVQSYGDNSGIHDEDHINNITELTNYLTNTLDYNGFQFTEYGTVVLKYKVDSRVPRIEHMYGFNFLYAGLKKPYSYYQCASRVSSDLTRGLSDDAVKRQFLLDMWNYYFGTDISSLSDSDLTSLFWFTQASKHLYKPMKTKVLIPNGSGGRQMLDNGTLSLTNTGRASIVDIFYAGAYNDSSFRFDNNLQALVTAGYSIVIVYVLKQGDYYSFMIKPVGQDRFVIPYSHVAVNMGFDDVYMIVYNKSNDNQTSYRLISKLVGTQFDCYGANIIKNRQALISRQCIINTLKMSHFKWKNDHMRIKFAYTDGNGTLGPISSVAIIGKPFRYGYNIWLVGQD